MSEDRIPCIECGQPCDVVRAGDAVRFTCPIDHLRHDLTVLSPDETGTEHIPGGREGQLLGPCRIVRAIGWEAGLPLYEGLDEGLGLPHSVSVLTHDTQHAHRFATVARMAAAQRHAALVGVTHLGREADALFVVKSPLLGRPLERVVAEGGPLPPRVALHIARTLADALAHLHAAGLVHRNIGPKTVLLLPTGDPVLRNYAYLAGPELPPQEGTVVGQGGYLAPEQARPAPLDPRADLYALGALLYLALSGRPAFPAAGPTEAIRTQLEGPTPAPLRVPGDDQGVVAALVKSLMDPEPENRPPDARTVAAAILSLEPSFPEEALPQDTIAGPPVAGGQGEDLLDGIDAGEPETPAERAVLDPEQALPVDQPRLHSMPTLEVRPTVGLDAGTDEEDEEPIDVLPIDDSQPAGGARQDAGEYTGQEELEDLGVYLDEPLGGGWGLKLGVLACAAVVAAALWYFLSQSQSPPKGAPPPSKKGVSPGPAAGKQEEKQEDPEVARLRRLEDQADDALADIQRAAGKTAPKDMIARCHAFLAKYGDTGSADPVKELLEKAKAAHEKAALNRSRAVIAALRSPRIPLNERLANADAFLAEVKGTKAADEVITARTEAIAAAEKAATLAWTRVRAHFEADLAKKNYGRALKNLTSAMDGHAGTKAGRAMADRRDAIRRDVADRLAAMKTQADTLMLDCRFAPATELFAEPLGAWDLPEAKEQAEKLVESVHAAREATVRGYAEFLERFGELAAAGRYDAARQAAQAAAGDTECKPLQRLLEGKAADAGMLQRAFVRAVAGARAIADKIKREGGKVWVQQAGGMRLMGTIANPTDEGLDVDVPGLKERVGWDRIAPSQLTVFAESAPGDPTVEDLCGLGLLALLGGDIKIAYETFLKAIEKSPAAADAVVACLRRNASLPLHVPGGAFLAGRVKSQETLPGYFLGRFEVSNIEYAFYCRVTQATPPPDWRNGEYPRGYDERPVVGITVEEARSYADWLGRRLPTPLEWERAVRGTEGRLYPWGDEFDRRYVNLKPQKPSERWRPRLVDVTRRPMRSDTFPFIHIIGNAREFAEPDDPKTLTKGYAYVVGLSVEDTERSFANFAWRSQRHDERNPFTSFRLAWPK